MKKIFIATTLALAVIATQAQDGLEKVIVEKYYEANATDASDPDISDLVPGAVTYRVYLDMEPGWEMQAVYGNAAHELFFNTTTYFWNNADRGQTYGEAIDDSKLGDNTIGIDSWISVGGASDGHFGLPKIDDVAPSILGGTYLANNDPVAGPLTTVDGLDAGTPTPPINIIVNGGFISGLGDQSIGASDLRTSGGSWGTLAGTTGHDPDSNKLLIAQFTTDGRLTFELNLQLYNPTTFVTRKFVAKAPTGVEKTHPSLTFDSESPNKAPRIVDFAAVPLTIELGTGNISFTAEAYDSTGTGYFNPGGIDEVRVIGLGAPVILGNVGGDNYEGTWTPPAAGTYNATLEVEDDEGLVTSSTPVSITVDPPNAAPVVVINEPETGDLIAKDSVVSIIASISDANNDIETVTLKINGNSVDQVTGVGAQTYAYSFSWDDPDKDLGATTIEIIALDELGKPSELPAITVSVFDPAGSPYSLGNDQTVPCDTINTFFVPLIREFNDLENVIGFDVELNYEPAKVSPTGVVTLNGDLGVHRDSTDYAMHIDPAASVVKISLFLTQVETDLYFNGTGQVMSIEFARTSGFGNDDLVTFQCGTIQESYNTGVFAYDSSLSVTYSTFTDDIYVGYLKFWADNSPIDGTTGAPMSVYTCNWSNQTSVDANGMFEYDFMPGSGNPWNNTKIRIQRQIDNSTIVMPVINGMDAYLTQRLVIDDPSFTPSVEQVIAMDVNLDGVVSAGDVSQINQRTVLTLGEFKQTVNYDDQGNRIDPRNSFDWMWIPQEVLQSDLGYRISISWPGDDGVGYSKYRVPFVDTCYRLNIQTAYGELWPSDPDECPISIPETWYGVMLGDVNGNWKDIAADGALKSEKISAAVVFDLANAGYDGEILKVPVSVASEYPVNSLDFNLKYDTENLSFESVIKYSPDLTAMYNHLDDRDIILFTSYSMDEFELDQPVAAIRFRSNGILSSENLLSEINAYVNGDEVVVSLTKLSSTSAADMLSPVVSIYPNPASTLLNVTVSRKSNIQLLDMSGKQVYMKARVNANERQEINVQNLSNGIYLMRIYNDEFTRMEKVVIRK